MNQENKDIKLQLIQNIKEWIRLESEINQIKTELNKKNKEKKGLTNVLIQIMKNNNKNEFDISGGKLIYKKNKVKKQINGKSLLKTLETYYANDKMIASELTNYILDNREIEIKETLKRKIA